MKIPRVPWVWIALVGCAALVLGAMTWLTHGVLASEKEKARAESRADLEERTRLALWRMDALGSATLLRENRYTPHDYSRFSTAFLRGTASDVWLHFTIEPDGTITSPEHRDAVMLKMGNSAVQPHTPTLEGIVLGGRLKMLRELFRENPLPGDEWALLQSAALEGENAWLSIRKDAPAAQNANLEQRRGNPTSQELRSDQAYQNNSNVSERAQRAKALAQAIDTALPSTENAAGAVIRNPNQRKDSTSRIPTEIGQLRAVWIGAELFLLRQTKWAVQRSAPTPETEITIEGVWLNRDALRDGLLRETADLLPRATLLPVEGTQAADDPLSLVSFPLRLDRGELIAAPARPLNRALVVGWAAVLAAILTAALLVRGVMRLSERRASFVSAVTHELRTPLTTFRLYSDMLESGAVKPEKRSEYLRVLSREADRLSHLVENVLSFSQVERGSARSFIRDFTLPELLEPMRERLAERLDSAGLTLEMNASGPWRVRADGAAVEHILFNLIDNAAKYAANGSPPLVEITTSAHERCVEIHVSDHGPGIPPTERRRIFRAFHKSAREAAESRPGVGLGLALSRRLAKVQGGSLDCIDSPNGARFVLTLPMC